MLERKGAGESEGWEALERQLKESTEDAKVNNNFLINNNCRLNEREHGGRHGTIPQKHSLTRVANVLLTCC